MNGHAGILGGKIDKNGGKLLEFAELNKSGITQQLIEK